jgi:hypothetical protein
MIYQAWQINQTDFPGFLRWFKKLFASLNTQIQMDDTDTLFCTDSLRVFESLKNKF